METLNIGQLESVATSALRTLWEKVAGFAPNLIGALLLLVGGYLIARLLDKLAGELLKRIGFDRACEMVGLQELLKKLGLEMTGSRLVAGSIFWLMMLMFLITASETLGLEKLAQTVETFMLYLPKVIGAALILVIGLLVAGFMRDLVRNAVSNVADEYAQALGNMTHGLLLIIVVMLSIGQLELDTSLLHNILQIVLLAAGLAMALTIGLGTRAISRQLVAGLYAREIFRDGAQIKVDGHAGKLIEVGTVTSKFRNADGTTFHIPNNMLIDNLVEEKTDDS